MKKCKKWLALLLAVALTLSVSAGPASVAFAADAEETETVETVSAAEEPAEEEAEEEPAEEEEAEPEEESAEDTEDAEETETEAENTSNMEEILDSVESTGEVEPKDAESEQETAQDETSDEEGADIEADAEASAQSLLPLEEVKAYLVLNSYSDDELASMSLDTILTMLQDSDGNSIEISSSATTVWRYVKDDSDGVEVYEEYTIGNGETIDLTGYEKAMDYQLELIVGSDGQLSAGNIRYIIKVYISGKYAEEFGFSLYSQEDSSTRTRIYSTRVQFAKSDSPMQDIHGNNVPMWNYIYYVEEGDYISPYLCVTSELEEHPSISLKIYEYFAYISGDYTEVTDDLLTDTPDKNYAGYKMTSGHETFIVIYYLDGVQADVLVLNFVLSAGASELTGDLYTVEDGSRISVVNNTNYSFNMSSYLETFEYVLKRGYEADDEYYLSLNAISGINGNVNDKIEKAVVGEYDSLEAAAEQEDIKEYLFSDDGYLGNFSDGIVFTIFASDDANFYTSTSGIAHVKIITTAYEGVFRSYTDNPIVGEADPWFQVTGAEQDGEELDTYIVENGGTINMDTMYGYGYQTVFINDADVDLSALQPVFWVADEENVKVYVNGNRISSGDTIDCSSGTVEFSVVIDGNVKNYMVSFVKQTSGAELYVCGPETREVFLDEYFEYKHDILIANIGDEELTGLRVELDATNCKLDDYWTVGGDGNDTLAAFTSTDSDSEYGELSNLAKIRILPDGEGEIEGTLTVYADGQDPIVINLTGRAQNPTIVTTGLDDAVKYVPYSYLVTTNNMYDWTDVTFTLVDGELPEGLELYSTTGEIYGTPQETGEFTFTVEASFTSETYSFDSATVELTLMVLDNTNDNVYNATDEGYDILTSVGEDTNGDHDYILTEYADEEFRSSGVLDEFIDLWLNGEKLVEGEDYTVESGSTKITILEQTLENKADANGTNTLAAEFRVDGDTSKTLKRTAQNFRLSISSDSDDDDDDTGTSSGDTGGTTDNTGSTGNTGGTTTGTDDDDDAGTTGTTGTTGTNGGTTTTTSTTTTTTGTTTDGTAASTTAQTATCIVSVTDADGNPVGDLQLELHSTPQTATTSSSGTATFGAVEFGSHTLYVKEDGTTKATKSFELVSGSAVSLSGDTVTAVPGGTFTLNVQFDGETLTLLSVDGVSTPQTGDSAQVMVWIALLLVSGLGLTAVQYKSHKRDVEG